MIRIYDKGVESRDASLQDCVRYEIEFKSDRAKAIAFELSAEESETATVAGRVSKTLVDHGIKLPRCWEPARHLDVAVSVPDSKTRLAWFAESVRPALIALEAAGMLPEALEALGLDHLTQTEVKRA